MRVLLCLFTIVVLIGAIGCSARTEIPLRPFPIDQLPIDTSAFPPGPGWVMGAEGPFVPASSPLGGSAGDEQIAAIFYGNGGVANEQIYRFESREEAAKEYDRRLTADFRQGAYDTPWIVPSEVSRSTAADQSFLACSEQGGIPMCQFIGQYEEYIVLFTTHMPPSFMTYTDLEHVLQAIDQQMVRYLQGDK
jgi:hypothetical protein